MADRCTARLVALPLVFAWLVACAADASAQEPLAPAPSAAATATEIVSDAPTATAPIAPRAAPTGPELGASTTIGTPVGTVGKSDMRGIVSYMTSIRADAGYRVTPSFYVGAYFTYGLPSVAESCKGVLPPQCAVNDTAAGLGFVYEPNPASRLSWWIGTSLGFEWLSVHWNGVSRGAPSGVWRDAGEFASGVDFTGLGVSQFQIGLDYKPTSTVRLGPFFDSALGVSDWVKASSQFNTPAQQEGSAYVWIQVGIRGSYVFVL
jgi:hypothetical protein